MTVSEVFPIFFCMKVPVGIREIFVHQAELLDIINYSRSIKREIRIQGNFENIKGRE